MKFVSSVIALGAAVAVYAQAPPPLPECAQTCIQNGLGSSNCDPTDFKCQCSDTAALSSVMNCVRTSCEPSQIPAIIAAASAICAEYGGTQVSGILSSAIASASSSVRSEISSRASATATSGNPRTTESAETVSPTLPTSTRAPNGAGKNAVAGGVGVAVALVGVLAAI
ncbi:hypothetical protein TWF281_011218 [Arthrobotrys megalospora]